MNKSPESQDSIRGESERKYFHQMLNMADADLDPFQYRLLGHYLRWAGHGGATQESIKQTAKITHMSVNTVRRVRNQLVELGYLYLYDPTAEQRGEGIAAIIEVRDRWLENMQRFSKQTPDSDSSQLPDSNLIEVSSEPDSNLIQPPDSNLIHSEELKSTKNLKREEQRDRAREKSADENGFTDSQKRKPIPHNYDDVPKQDRLEIIRAWANNLTASPIAPYKRDPNHEAAADIFRAGYRAPQVALFVKAKKLDGWWKDKTLTLEKVAQLMPEWLLNQSAPAKPAPRSEDTNDSPALRALHGIGERHARSTETTDTPDQPRGKGLLGFDTPTPAGQSTTERPTLP